MLATAISILSVLVTTASPEAQLIADIDTSMAQAGRFLVQAQSEDGGWRSKNYGSFRDGWALTPLVMSALLFVPPSPEVEAAYKRGADFVASMVKPDGTVRPEAMSYPIYAVAGGVLVLSVPANRRHKKAKEVLLATLLERQLAEQHGYDRTDPSYGGFGYYAGRLTKPPPGAPRDELLSSNMSSTLFAIGALKMAGLRPDDPVLKKAAVFIERCQNLSPDGKVKDPRFDDGGFHFTPANAIQNKADKAGDDASGRPRYRSYGSMTADGIRALRQLGYPLDHPRVAAAAAWLHNNYSPERAPGAYPKIREPQRRSVYHYWLWTSAHALMALGQAKINSAVGEIHWPFWHAKSILRRQLPDGTWRNLWTDLREDDPLVATPLALAGLGVSRYYTTFKLRTSIAMPDAAAGTD